MTPYLELSKLVPSRGWAYVYEVAEAAHEGQYRDGGLPFIVHPLRVALGIARLGGEEGVNMQWKASAVRVALAHDVLEDAPEHSDNLAAVLSQDELNCVVALTKRDDETKSQYYERATQSYTTKMVKIADRYDNIEDMDAWKLAHQKTYLIDTMLNLAPRVINLPSGQRLAGRVMYRAAHMLKDLT